MEGPAECFPVKIYGTFLSGPLPCEKQQVPCDDYKQRFGAG